MREVLVYLGLGTNLGDRFGNLRGALRMLSDKTGLRLLRCSEVYETEPWGGIKQPPFLNCVAEATTVLEPEALLTLCKEMEETLGRVPGVRWGPRLIDVDILLYGPEVIDLPHLEIPHPRLHLRAFALVPLAELAPESVLPSAGQSIGQLAQSSDGREGVSVVGVLPLSLESPDC